MSRLYLSPPDVGPKEREALLRAFDSNWIAPLGPEVDAFEEEFAEFVGAPSAAALSSGTAALHLALLAAGVGRGDVVIVSTLTFAASANAIVYCGADPWFVDSDAANWNLDPELVATAIDDARHAGRSVRAVIAVDLYGQSCPMDELVKLCDGEGVALIEDAAESLGASWLGTPTGGWGVPTAFSFNGNKIMTTSGGGMLVGTPEETDRARHLASQAREPFLHYEHTEVGYNYRMSNLLAALGRAQLAGLPDKVEHRRTTNAAYRSLLSDIGDITFMPWDERGHPNGWLTVVQLSDDLMSGGVTPATVCRDLNVDDIEARPVWKPMHRQPAFADAPATITGVADDLFRRGVCLPSGSALSEGDIERVVVALRGAVVGSPA